MAGPQQSVKRVAISKANAQVVATVGIAAFLTVFSLVASHALWVQNAYLAKVTKLQDKANKQLQANLKASDNLADRYQSFTSTSKNVLGGDPKGSGDNDGDNAKIVLDALPSSYDFPALATSIQKILSDNNLHVSSITGTDDEIAQQAAAASPDPQPVPMNFSFSVDNVSYDAIQNLMTVLQHSIRPIQVDSMSLAGAADDMTVTVSAHTFFQPPKTVNITNQQVK